MAGPPPSWADLPPDLGGLVLGRLPSHLDRARFAAVCPQWRSAARQVLLPPLPPLLALKNGKTFYSMPTGEPFRICFPGCDNGFPTFSRIDSDFATASGNWLVYRQFYSLLLLDPFSGDTMTLPGPSKVNYKSDVPSTLPYLLEVIKLIVCSSDLIAALFCTSIGSNQIAVCRPGATLWSVAWDLPLWITDMAFYQGKLYALDYGEDLLALDISVDDNTGDPQVVQIGRVIKVNYSVNPFSKKFNDPMTFKRMLYLVESRGSLLLVRRNIFYKNVDCKGQIHTFAGQCEPQVSVFEADFVQSRWTEMGTLADDQALFLGPCSRAVCMPQCDSPGNRIWFLDDYKDFHHCEEYLESSSSSGTSSMAYHYKPFSPLPMISWGDHRGRAGAAWLFASK